MGRRKRGEMAYFECFQLLGSWSKGIPEQSEKGWLQFSLVQSIQALDSVVFIEEKQFRGFK